ncbi:hypothetical protein BDM02DRAFT_3262619 [Thelephora ganbajun]|uniref:Uncharacterized protein n=1 Tax=Thelephora ganbajun TaxID=370292 RepID=A0ACB6Z951_THEGA|nr:hypothetical protein BDM02DRAFT_3262619 [Thelephora ganbajun]
MFISTRQSLKMPAVRETPPSSLLPPPVALTEVNQHSLPVSYIRLSEQVNTKDEFANEHDTNKPKTRGAPVETPSTPLGHSRHETQLLTVVGGIFVQPWIVQPMPERHLRLRATIALHAPSVIFAILPSAQFEFQRVRSAKRSNSTPAKAVLVSERLEYDLAILFVVTAPEKTQAKRTQRIVMAIPSASSIVSSSRTRCYVMATAFIECVRIDDSVATGFRKKGPLCGAVTPVDHDERWSPCDIRPVQESYWYLRNLLTSLCKPSPDGVAPLATNVEVGAPSARWDRKFIARSKVQGQVLRVFQRVRGAEPQSPIKWSEYIPNWLAAGYIGVNYALVLVNPEVQAAHNCLFFSIPCALDEGHNTVGNNLDKTAEM